MNGKENEMKITTGLSALVLVGIFTLPMLSPAKSDQASPDQIGFQFLDRLVVLLVEAAAPGGGGSKDISPAIIDLAKELKAAQKAKEVDDLFAVRYSRLLSAARQALLMDPEVLFWPMYRSAMVDFIEERTGRMPDWKDLLFIVNDHGGAGVGLGMIADAIISEVVSLHIYLMTLAQRPDILKGYLEKSLKGGGAGK
jgi:hypothetical protein